MKRCFAYEDDGRICGKPATHIDKQRGMMVCAKHYRVRGAEALDARTPNAGGRTAGPEGEAPGSSTTREGKAEGD